jgi:hypothetical protein
MMATSTRTRPTPRSNTPFGSPGPRSPSLSHPGIAAIERPPVRLTSFLRAPPRLSCLDTAAIEPTEGDWTATFARLRDLQLRESNVQGPLEEVGGVELWERTPAGYGGMDQLERYVRKGGGHPLVQR